MPQGKFQASQHLELLQEELPVVDSTTKEESGATGLDAIVLGPDQVLLRVEAFAIDAFLRTLLYEGSFHYSLKVGETMRASGYATVVRTGSHQAYPLGSKVVGLLPVKTFAVVDKSPFLSVVTPLPGVTPRIRLDLLGISGLSAYVGIFLVARPPRKGETCVISAAAGGVGTVACQMAKQNGARVVGIAGGPDKTRFLVDQVGIDAAIDYKHPTLSIQDQLVEACPNGIDFFLDNVGGDILDVVLENINTNARIVICGAISQYDTGTLYSSPRGPQQYLKLAEKNASMAGFTLGHYFQSSWNSLRAVIYILWHYWRGNLKSFVQVEKGIESFGLALEKLLSGKNTGRLMVDVTGIMEHA